TQACRERTPQADSLSPRPSSTWDQDMNAGNPNPPVLSDDQGRALAALLARFEQTWVEGQLREWEHLLPPPDAPWRRPALLGMIHLDLANLWQRGRRPSAETYLDAYPELGTVATIPVELIRAEAEARR